MTICTFQKRPHSEFLFLAAALAHAGDEVSQLDQRLLLLEDVVHL